MHKICLNMIVKNESSNIERLFNSLKSVIDYYLIVDTGSEDDTVDKIKSVANKLKIPGEIYEREWVNFGYNRQQALTLAIGKADYLLTIDADEELILNDFDFNDLKYDSYSIIRKYANLEYYLPFLINIKDYNNLGWRWNAPVHNYLTAQKQYSVYNLNKKETYILSHVNQGGKSKGRSLKEKYLHDAKLLKDELIRNPNDTRSQFYLAQSYFSAQEYELAEQEYSNRIKMNGWSEERFVSCLKLIVIYLNNNDLSSALNILPKALIINENRANEIYYYLIEYLYNKNKYSEAYKFIELINFNQQVDTNCLFVTSSIYEWLLKDKCSMVAYRNNDYKLMFKFCNELLLEAPVSELKRIHFNMNYAFEREYLNAK